MDQYDYENYGMEYGETYSSTQGDGNKSLPETTPEEETHPPVALSAFDPLRLFEFDPGSYENPRRSPVSSVSSAMIETPPAVAFFSDHHRVSIHPLGVIEKPVGISKSFWNGLDADRMFQEVSTLPPSPQAGHTAPGEAAQVPAKRGSTAVSGSTGEDGEKDEDLDKYDPTEMPFLDHLEEFRWALLKSIFVIVIAMVASWFLSDEFYSTITRLAKDADLPLIITRVMEPIMLKVQMALVMGLVIALPFVFYFVWSFVSPGLYKREKTWIMPLVIGATFCFFVGASLAYFLVIPFMLKFLIRFIPPDVMPLITIGDFVSKMLKFTLFFGVIFELPMVAYVLAKIGVLKHTFMAQYRKYAIVIIFILGAIFTPPDPYSQIMMAIPLIVLYEISILVARFGGRKTLL